MREIVSFNKEIPLKTKIFKITSISLEHTLVKNDHQVTGDFLISGSYKITGASPLEEEFHYKLPAEIVIDEKYNTDDLEIDIDNFTYEVYNEEILKVWIDIKLDYLKEEVKEELKDKEEQEKDRYLDSLDGLSDEKNEESVEDSTTQEEVKDAEVEEEFDSVLEEIEELTKDASKQREAPSDEVEILDFNDYQGVTEDLLKQVDTKEDLTIQKEEKVEEEKPKELKEEENEEMIEEKEEPTSLFMSFDNTKETYSTYRVYIVRENDSIDAILAKYKITREQLEEYNNLDEVKLGTKLIIPSTKENE